MRKHCTPISTPMPTRIPATAEDSIVDCKTVWRISVLYNIFVTHDLKALHWPDCSGSGGGIE